MRADQKQDNRHRHQVLLCRCVLVSVVDLLPHVEVVICPSIEVKWDAAYPMEHEVRGGHICEVCQGP